MVELRSRILTIRLWQEIVVRNKLTAIPHILLIFSAAFICQEMHRARPFTLIPYYFVLVGCALRMVILRSFTIEEFPSKIKKILYYFALTSIGFGWASLHQAIHLYYEHNSIVAILSYLSLMGIISASLPNNAARPAGFICVLIPIIAIMTFNLINEPWDENILIACGCYFYGVFHLFQIRVSYFYIKKFIENDFAITLERDKLQNLVNAVPGYVSFIDSNMKYISINEFGRAIFDLGEYKGVHIRDKHPDSEFGNFISKFILENKKTATSEIKLKTIEGFSTFIVSIQRSHDTQGGAVIVAIPINELIETREKIKEQEAKAMYTAKLASLGEMAAGIAHEINNPLAIILGSSDQLMRQLKRSELSVDKLVQLTDKIQQTVGRISLIIKSLRVLARNGEKDPFMPFKLEAILEPSIEISRQRFKEEMIQLEVIKPQNEIICLGREIQLSQVMMNLLSNAFDAAIEGQSPKWVRLWVKSEEKHVDICIQDSGKGIPQEIRNKIMEPFFTTKPINKGTGLGLSISKSIMEQHGGMLAHDDQEKHTTFIMRIKKNEFIP